MKTRKLLPFKEKSKHHFILYLIVGALYTVSTTFVAFGIVYLFIILFVGELNIKNGQVFALWILLYFPLRYFKKQME
jgi:hypothetical protein